MNDRPTHTSWTKDHRCKYQNVGNRVSSMQYEFES